MLLLASAACAKEKNKPLGEEEPQARVVLGAAGESPVLVAARIYAQRCAACHGVGGKGDGPSGVFLKPKPRDFSAPSWSASVDDPYLRKIIVQGGVAVGKSAAMPPNYELAQHEDVLAELLKKLRGFGTAPL